MHDSKLLCLLKHLSDDDIKALKLFVHSPFLNKNKVLITLFEYIIRYAPLYTSSKLARKNVFKKLYPTKEYDTNRLSVLISKLYKLIQEYLVISELQNNDFRFKRMITKSFSNRNIQQSIEGISKKLVKELKQKGIKDIHYYSELFQINNELYTHPDTIRFASAVNSINEACENLDLFFILARLRYICEMYMRRIIIGVRFNEDIVPLICQLVEQHYVDQHPAFSMYLSIIKLCKESPDEAIFLSVKKRLFEEHESMSSDDSRAIHGYLINITNFVINAGKDHFAKQQFELYQFGIEEQLIKVDEQLTGTTFINIAVVGSACGEFDWIENFIQKYQFFLHPTLRNSVVALAMAFLFFHKQNYDKAHSILIDLDKWEYNYQWRGRSLRLRCYYENFLSNPNDFDFVLNSIQTFQGFIQKDTTLSENRKKGYLNFSKWLKKIATQKNKKNMEYRNILSIIEKEKLLNELNEEKVIMVKKWLISKLKEL